MHVHLREPARNQRDIASGLQRSVAGGFYTVCAMPNTHPVNDNAAVTRFVIEPLSARIWPRAPIGAVTKNSEGTNSPRWVR